MSGALYERPELRSVTGPALRPGGTALTLAALEKIRLAPGAAVLDIGCGPGETLRLLRGRGFTAFGLDVSRVFVREAVAHGPVVMGRAEELPFADASMDAVFCECVLSLTRDKGAALAEVRRVLRPGGRLVLADVHTVPGGRVFSAGPDAPASCVAGAESLETLRRLLRTAGFAIEYEDDATKALKELAARMVFAWGSLESFWRAWLGTEAAPGQECGCSTPPRLGYVRFIAS